MVFGTDPGADPRADPKAKMTLLMSFLATRELLWFLERILGRILRRKGLF